MSEENRPKMSPEAEAEHGAELIARAVHACLAAARFTTGRSSWPSWDQASDLTRKRTMALVKQRLIDTGLDEFPSTSECIAACKSPLSRVAAFYTCQLIDTCEHGMIGDTNIFGEELGPELETPETKSENRNCAECHNTGRVHVPRSSGGSVTRPCGTCEPERPAVVRASRSELQEAVAEANEVLARNEEPPRQA